MTGTDSAILDAARDVLRAEGYGGFTVELVAARAGVETAAIHRRWAGKDALLIEVLADAAPIVEIPDMGNSRAELSLALTNMMSQYADRHAFEPTLLAFAADHAGDPAAMEQLRQRCLPPGREQLTAVLRRAAARGDLPPNVDTDLMQDVWAGTIAYRRLVSGGALTVDLVDPLLDMAFSGMAPPRAAEGTRPDHAWPWWLEEGREWLSEVAFGRVYPLGDPVPVRALAAVPHTATISGHPVTISTALWRDFMPGDSADGHGLTVIVTVTAAGTGVLPRFLRADRIAVLHGDEVWVAPLVEERPIERTARRFQVMARNGPRWEPGTPVDVVVQLLGLGAAVQLVRTNGQDIERVE